MTNRKIWRVSPNDKPEDMAWFTYSNFTLQAFSAVFGTPEFVFFER
jgi:hypothetical protein